MIKVLTATIIFFISLFSHAKAEPPLEQMVGSMIMCGFQGKTAPREILSAIKKGTLGGVILFNNSELNNIESPQQLKALTASLQSVSSRPLLIGIDQEGGNVSRLKSSDGFKEFLGAKCMGEMSFSEVRQIGYLSGIQLYELGINLNFAPVVDLNYNNNGPVCGLPKERCFGSDPYKVAELAYAYGEGLLNAGVLPTLKHFPGLGSAVYDSHLTLPDISNTWKKVELIPYKEAIKKGWLGLIMVAHSYNKNIDSENSSSLSENCVQGLLRKTLGWQGVVISDDLQMKGASDGMDLEEVVKKAIIAGNDILLYSNNLSYFPNSHEKLFNIIINLIRNGEISEDRIKDSWKRLEILKASLPKQSLN